MSAHHDFLNVLEERGFIHQTADAEGLTKKLNANTCAGYIGFDCTAPSLHAGSLVQIMMLHWLQQTGHEPIVLMGGGTTRVGDPSGKDEARKMLTDADIENNITGIQSVFSRFLTFGTGQGQAKMVNNADWLCNLNYIDMLRDVGRHFSVNRMLTMDSVKMRLEREQPLSFLEFNYMVLQAYDFVELHKRYGCILQMGGSDQWGNIVSGIDLGRRMAGLDLHAITTPLLTTANGAKMGKTAQGAVWLSKDMLPVFDYWQFWRNTADADVEKFLKLFTTLPISEIKKLSALQGAEINEAKKVLATEATALLHGKDEALKAAEAAQQTFEKGEQAQNLPIVEMEISQLKEGLGILTAFVEAGLANSTSEVRRQLKGGALRVNNEAIADERLKLNHNDIKDGQIILSMGKKQHRALRFK